MRSQRRRRTVVLNALLASLIAAGGVGAYLALKKTDTVTPPRTVPASRMTVSTTVSASGTLSSALSVSADFGASGTIKEIDVKVGQQVKQGDVLAKLDDTLLQRQYDAAAANLDSAQKDLDKVSAASPSPDPAALAKSTSSVANAEVQVEQARTNLNAATLKAPAAGTVTAVNGVVGGPAGGTKSGGSGGTGAAASTGSTTTSGLFQLADLNQLQVRSSIAEADALRLKAGQQASVTLNAAPGQRLAATVAAIDVTPTTTSNVVTYGVTLAFATQPAGAKLGQTATVEVTIAKADDVLAVPSTAVRGIGNRHSVTVLENGVQVQKQVEIGLQGDQYTQITSGLSEGQQVVLSAGTGGTGGGVQPQRSRGAGGNGGTNGRGGNGGAGTGGTGNGGGNGP